MQYSLTMLCAVSCAFYMTAPVAGQAADATVEQGVRIFNGKDLEGWAGKEGWWYVEDGAITSESTEQKPCIKCNYLIWQGGEPYDFELNLDFKLSSQGNSGVQLRSRRVGDWDTFGYQADMSGDGKLIGFVYHHKRGLIAGRGEDVTINADGTRSVRKLGDPQELLKTYRFAEWNHYRIVCQGPRIQLFINNTLMCRFEDNSSESSSGGNIIALQMHPGPPMKVQFKNIFLKTAENVAQRSRLSAPACQADRCYAQAGNQTVF